MNIDASTKINIEERNAGISAWLNVNVKYWRAVSMAFAITVSVPILMIFLAWLEPANAVWQHLVDTVLLTLLSNTLILLLGVFVGVMVLGVGLSWLTAMCEFPGRRFFDWALMLPLAVPVYVLAFVVIALLDYSGPIQSWLRMTFDLQGELLPKVRSAGGLIAVMVLVFYPYVYMLTRAAFMSQGRNLIDSGRMLGLGPWQAFFRVAIPMARPAIAAGVSLALMETLADFGAVSVFNYDTFTTAIYKTWLGLFSLTAAAQLSSLLLLFVFVALISEKRLRHRAKYIASGKLGADRYQLAGIKAIAATALATTVLLLAFVLPVCQLLIWSWQVLAEEFGQRYLRFLLNTILLGSVAAFLTVSAALMLAYTNRLLPDRLMAITVRISTMGFALPGSVLAVGVMLMFVWLDSQITIVLSQWFNISGQQLLSNSLLVLIFAYSVRFMANAYGPVDTAFERIKPSILQAARSLGAGNWQILWRISMPMLRSGMLGGLLLVFVEVMKEMPATLLLRPFGWDTLATRIFELTSEGQWERAALPAATLILVGLIPVILLVKRSAEK